MTNGMLTAAAHAVANLTDPSVPGAALLPPVEELRDTSVAVATAVASAAWADGVATAIPPADLMQHVRSLMWAPSYRPIVAE